MVTYTIYADALDATCAALDKLAKKATRYGVPFSYNVGEEHPETVRVWARDEVNRVEYVKDSYTVAAVDIMIDTDGLVKKDGWTVCAHIEHGDIGNIVTGLNGESVNSEWFHVKAHCDHCNSNRFRKVTYMCRHESGEMKQVGSACLKDYTGINPAVALMASEVRDLLQTVSDCAPEDWERTPHAVMYDVATVIGLAVDEIERHGYRKSQEPDSTKSRVIIALKEGETPTERGAAKATAIVEWLKELAEVNRKQVEWCKGFRERARARAAADGFEYDAERRLWYKGTDAYSNEYKLYADYDGGEKCPYELPYGLDSQLDLERNCSPLAVSGYTRARHIGLLAYMPLAYDRYMERKAKREQIEADRKAQAATSEYVGQIKERLTISTATATLVTSWETDYGVTYLYKFTDKAGNVFIWKASSKQDVTACMTLKGTVKEHNERDGVKQTVLTRCKLTAA